ncbi:MAG: ribonuclease H-like domain-containing protein [Acidobacteriota bacterium]|nr:ribonuclease H-like domain-containing protein [Acidobacteriota bacterium]
MLSRSFIHVPGIGERREQKLWRGGYTDWLSFERLHPEGAWKDLVLSRLTPDRAARDLPRRETWRLLTQFPGRTAYLDIETEGLSRAHDSITCIGLSDGCDVEVFVRGRNLHRFPDAIRRYDLLVTYSGSCFDLPVLAEAYPRIDFRRFLHLDLRYPLGRLGLKGGLKAVERKLGLSRPRALDGADGYTAVLLWRAHRHGHPNALETLARYCLEDVANLKPIAAHVYNRMTARLPFEVPRVRDTKAPPIPYRADRSLVRSLTR